MKSRMLPRRAAKLLAGAIIVALVGSGLSACSSSSSQSPHKLKVVASTAVWGSIVEAIAGDKVEIKSIVNNPNQDPHSFEASVRDQAAVNSADLVLLTGNGYDAFMNQLIAASHQPKDHIVELAPNDKKVKPFSGSAVNDPHVWYDFDIVSRIANDIKLELDKADPVHAASFAIGNSKFQKGVTSLKKRLKNVSHVTVCSGVERTKGSPCPTIINLTNILQPESVGLRLIAKFSVDTTPPTVRQAVINGNDISVKDMNAIKVLFFGEIVHRGLFFGPGWPIQWLVLNSQQTNPQIEQIKAWAQKAGMTKFVSFSESLPTGKTYLTWMSDNLAQLEYLRATEPARF